MGRLFVGPRELRFISDITKELIKDTIGNFILYYPISELKTKVHSVYDESVRKIFDNPIKLDAIVDSRFQDATKISGFGADAKYKIDVFLQYRDLVEKGLDPVVGDFFQFSDIFYEIVERVVEGNIYGLPEHKRSVKLVGNKARQGQFDAILRGPTDIKYKDQDAVVTDFEQQRGERDSSLGPSGDTRELQNDGVTEQPLDGKRKVSDFYNERE